MLFSRVHLILLASLYSSFHNARFDSNILSQTCMSENHKFITCDEIYVITLINFIIAIIYFSLENSVRIGTLK